MATYKAEQLELLKEVPIEKLGLQIKDLSCLKQEHVHTIGDLLKMNKNEMILLNAMGRLSIEHIEERLYSYVASVDAQKAEIKEPEVSQSSPNWDPIRDHNQEEKDPIDASILELDIRSATYYALRSAQLPTIRSIISETREAISSKNRRLGEYAINEICEAIIKYASQNNIENEIKDYPLFSQHNEEVKTTETNTGANKASQTVYNPFSAPISDLNINSRSYHALKSTDIRIILDVLQNRKNYLEKEYPKITPEILEDIDKAIRRLTSDHGCLSLALSFPFFDTTNAVEREDSEASVNRLEVYILEILKNKKCSGSGWMTASAIAKALELEHADIAASVTPVELREVLMNSKDIVKNDVYYQFSGAVGQQPLQSSESSKQPDSEAIVKELATAETDSDNKISIETEKDFALAASSAGEIQQSDIITAVNEDPQTVTDVDLEEKYKEKYKFTKELMRKEHQRNFYWYTSTEVCAMLSERYPSMLRGKLYSVVDKILKNASWIETSSDVMRFRWREITDNSELNAQTTADLDTSTRTEEYKTASLVNKPSEQENEELSISMAATSTYGTEEKVEAEESAETIYQDSDTCALPEDNSEEEIKQATLKRVVNSIEWAFPEEQEAL